MPVNGRDIAIKSCEDSKTRKKSVIRQLEWELSNLDLICDLFRNSSSSLRKRKLDDPVDVTDVKPPDTHREMSSVENNRSGHDDSVQQMSLTIILIPQQLMYSS